MDDILNFKRDDEDDFYHILGCDELSTVEQIMAEYRLKAIDCHPDKNPSSDAVEKFQRLQKAKDVLTDSSKRADYDTWKRSGLAMTFDVWAAKKDSLKMSMHWAVKTKKEPMIEPAPGSDSLVNKNLSQEEIASSKEPSSSIKNEPRIFWHSNNNGDMIRKFRNYEI